jgi:hypothetical protein
MGGESLDYDYIIRVIQYLDRRHGIRFFIGSRDFDVLYRWWEKRIPDVVLHESLDRVVERRRRLGRPLERFSAFSHEVRRQYRTFLSLDIGRPREESADAHAEFRSFLGKFPPPLEFMRDDFEALFQRRLRGEAPQAGPLQEKLLARFRDDGELNAKTAWFLGNIDPRLRRPEIERKYRLNYLLGKFGVPPLE